jgi:glucokinase
MLVDALVARARETGLALDGVGIGLPGLVDARRGMMISNVNYLPEFAHVPLADQVTEHTGLPSFVDNDVNALALGEWAFGLGRGAHSLVVLAIGSGIGGGIVLDGKLVRGATGSAGEFGHLPLDRDGARCVCGMRGCVSTYLCGIALTAEACRRTEATGTLPASTSLLAPEEDGRHGVGARHLFEASAAGDATARRTVRDACRALGATVGVIVNTLNPEVIVVTGGVVASLVPLESEVRREIGAHALEHALGGTRIHLVAGDKRESVRGGAALVGYELARRRGASEESRNAEAPSGVAD